MASKSNAKGQGTGHPSKGGNGGKMGSIKSSSEQNEIRRAAKRRPRVSSGMSTIVADPTVGATKAVRAAAAITRNRHKDVSETRHLMAVVADDHPLVTGLTYVARRSANKFLEFYSKSPVGDPANHCPRKWSEAKVWAVLSDEDKAHPKAVSLGIARAKRAIDAALELTTQPVS